MKNALTALLLAASAHSATAQRGACRSTSSTNVGSCNNGTDPNTSCNTWRQLTLEGQHCDQSKRLTGTFETVQDCAEAVDADVSCLAKVFSFGDGQCDCATSDTCTVGIGGEHALFVVTAETDSFCSCPALFTKQVRINDKDYDHIFGGRRCDTAYNVGDQLFIRELNALSDAVNSGRVKLSASAISQATKGEDLFNDVSLVAAASLLGRGFDGEVKLAMSLVSDVPLEEWQHIISEAIVENVVADGFDVNTHHFRIVNKDTLSTRVNCVCPPLTMPGQPCNNDTAAACTQHIIHMIVTKDAAFEEYQIALIIAACVVAVCLIAIGLSFVKSQETINAEKNPDVGVRACGLQQLCSHTLRLARPSRLHLRTLAHAGTCRL
jgi:hypothetical protein